MKKREISNDRAARELDVTSACIGNWANGKSIPTLCNMRKIGLWSGGWVKARDFYREMEGEK